jgi:hypothetical protein
MVALARYDVLTALAALALDVMQVGLVMISDMSRR